MTKSILASMAGVLLSAISLACPTSLNVIEQSCGNFVFYLAETPVGNVIWDFGDGNNTTGSIEIQHTYAEDGTYVVSAIFSGPECAETSMLFATVEVNCGIENCPAFIGVESIDCDTYVFSLDGVETGDVAWDFGDGITENSSVTADHTYASNGVYIVTAVYNGPACPIAWTNVLTVQVNCSSEIECPTEIWSGAGTECGVMNYEIGSFVEGENVTWFPGDGSGPQQGGHFFSHTYTAPGNYSVCAFYTTPLCPNGIEICTSITVESCNENLCPTGITADTIDCDTYVLHIEGIDNAEVSWDFGDGNLGVGGINADHTWAQNGLYIVTVVVNAPQCPILPPIETFTFEFAIQVDCAVATECPTEIWSGAGAECGVMNFEIGSFVEGENVTWFPGDGSGPQQGGHFFTHAYANPGIYDVCAFYTTPLCPNGVELCTTITVEDCNTTVECPTEMWSGAGTECGVMNFEIGSFVEGENVMWFPGDDSGAVQGGHFFSHTYANPGTYTVCAFYTTPLCPNGVELCTVIEVVPCEQPCNQIGFGIDSYLLEGGTPWLTYMISNVETGILVTSGAAEYTENDPYFDTPLCLPDGCYHLSIDNNNPLLIGQGVNIFFILNSVNLMENATIIYQDDIAITYLIGVNTDCGAPPTCEASFEPVFTATPGQVEFINNSSFSGVVEFLWEYGNGSTSDGPSGNVQYESNGVYNVCLTVTTGNCSNTSCQLVIVDDMETPCEFNDVTLVIDANYFEPINELIWLSVSVPFGPVFQTSIETDGIFNDTLSLCIPDGCYEVSMFSELPVQALSIICAVEGLNTQQLGNIQLNIGETTTFAAIGVNMDCTIGIEETTDKTILAFPNPASDNIQFVSNESIERLEIFDMTGKRIASFNPNQSQVQFNTSAWSAGLYVAHLTSRGKMERVIFEIAR
jgi:PKD repeat protein